MILVYPPFRIPCVHSLRAKWSKHIKFQIAPDSHLYQKILESLNESWEISWTNIAFNNIILDLLLEALLQTKMWCSCIYQGKWLKVNYSWEVTKEMLEQVTGTLYVCADQCLAFPDNCFTLNSEQKTYLLFAISEEFLQFQYWKMESVYEWWIIEEDFNQKSRLKV